jgi:hypothetical protein
VLEFYERFLNHVSSLFPIPSYSPRILKKWDLKSLEDLLKLASFTRSPASHRFGRFLTGENDNTCVNNQD